MQAVSLSLETPEESSHGTAITRYHCLEIQCTVLVFEDWQLNNGVLERALLLQALIRKYTPIAAISGIVLLFLYIRYAFY